jgi:long-chain acyl-CoA synthetase
LVKIDVPSELLETHSIVGGEVGFWQGSVEKLMDDFGAFKPSILVMVPRLLNKLHDRVMLATEKKGFLARGMLQLALWWKSSQIERGDFSQDTLWDWLVFDKVRRMFGGRVERVISSSAPLSPDVARFARAVFSCSFTEGYGQTECTTATWQTLDNLRSGEAGIPTPVNHIKLVDVPEKEYFARDRVGEICIRSKAVFKGYLNDSEKTLEAIDGDGWLHTGDVGQWTEHNTLKIIDRKKNIFKVRLQSEHPEPNSFI